LISSDIFSLDVLSEVGIIVCEVHVMFIFTRLTLSQVKRVYTMSELKEILEKCAFAVEVARFFNNDDLESFCPPGMKVRSHWH
jgi:hypothetical protein